MEKYVNFRFFLTCDGKSGYTSFNRLHTIVCHVYKHGQLNKTFFLLRFRVFFRINIVLCRKTIRFFVWTFCVTNLRKQQKLLPSKEMVTNNDNAWLFSLVIVRNIQKLHYINHTWQKTGYPLSNTGVWIPRNSCMCSLFWNTIVLKNIVHWTVGSMWQIIQKKDCYYNEVVGTVARWKKSMTVWWHLHKLRSSYELLLQHSIRPGNWFGFRWNFVSIKNNSTILQS